MKCVNLIYYIPSYGIFRWKIEKNVWDSITFIIIFIQINTTINITSEIIKECLVDKLADN